MEAVRLRLGHHQKRLIDQIDVVGEVEAHEGQQPARGVAAIPVRRRMRLAVMFDVLAVKVEWQCGYLLVGRHATARVIDLAHRTAGCFLGTRVGCITQTVLDSVALAVDIAATPDAAGVEHVERRDRLKPVVDLRRCQRIAAAPADSVQTDATYIDASIATDGIGHPVNVFDSVGQLVDLSRLARSAPRSEVSAVIAM
jgi:hypothetical protein